MILINLNMKNEHGKFNLQMQGYEDVQILFNASLMIIKLELPKIFSDVK